MSNSLKESLEGLGIGLIGGLVIGISEADWLRLALGLALVAYAGKVLHQSKTGSPGNSLKVAFTGIASFFAVLIGLYINGQQLFEQSPKKAIDSWVDAGFSPAQARALYLTQMTKKVQKNSTVSPAMKYLIRSMITQTRRGDSLEPAKDSISDN